MTGHALIMAPRFGKHPQNQPLVREIIYAQTREIGCDSAASRSRETAHRLARGAAAAAAAPEVVRRPPAC